MIAPSRNWRRRLNPLAVGAFYVLNAVFCLLFPQQCGLTAPLSCTDPVFRTTLLSVEGLAGAFLLASCLPERRDLRMLARAVILGVTLVLAVLAVADASGPAGLVGDPTRPLLWLLLLSLALERYWHDYFPAQDLAAVVATWHERLDRVSTP